MPHCCNLPKKRSRQAIMAVAVSATNLPVHPKFGEGESCANCGATEGLLRCSRCKNIWFCSVKCHKSYWPVHRSFCRVNEFAEAIEATEPKFAAFLRNHGKQAVIKDAEVERLERASQAVSVLPSRQEVMESMYGRADPKPQAPSYSPEEWLAMEERRQAEAAQVALLTPQDKAWLALPSVRKGFGRDCGSWRWIQDMNHVDIVIKLPAHVAPSQVRVVITSSELDVVFCGETFLCGRLCRAVDVAGCSWYIDVDTGLLHIQLLKRSRKGRYLLPAAAELLDDRLRLTGCRDVAGGPGGEGPDESAARKEPVRRPACAADTYWATLLVDGPVGHAASDGHAPSEYYIQGGAEEVEE